MSFTVDRQTADDLNLLGEYKNNSIFSLFNQTVSRGGSKMLEEWFRAPLSDAGLINKRTAVIRFFYDHEFTFRIPADDLERVDRYFKNDCPANSLAACGNAAKAKLYDWLGRKEEYLNLYEQVETTIRVLDICKKIFGKISSLEVPSEYKTVVEDTLNSLEDRRLAALYESATISWPALARYDYLLRNTLRKSLEIVLQQIYELDVYIAVGRVARERGFVFARASSLSEHTSLLEIEQLYHPHLTGAVRNDVSIGGEQNVMFLTGANMAGKSTLMKSVGIALYLAHMGFPVAAARMEFSIMDGMYTSINVPDNLNLGYSHFYAEVLRVKMIAQQVSSGKKLLVIFDELFKGTNVKDAFDATVNVSEAFAENKHCTYIISTHITEAGHALAKLSENFKFEYLPTIMNDGVPCYTYKLREGITDDRQGMIIINRERIIEILEEAACAHTSQ